MAVEPILASALWAAQDTPHTKDSDPPSNRRKLSSNCHSIDKALQGGLGYGNIHCISAENDCGAKEICYAFLKSHLLGSEEANATMIDTTNSFDVRKLHAQLVATLREADTAGEVQAQALRTLDRVRITKAFDFVGLTESVVELSDDLEGRQSGLDGRAAEPDCAQQRPRGTVGDSESEEEDILKEPLPQTAPKAARQPDHRRQSHAQAVKPYGHGLLIIDDIGQVTTPLLKANHTQGQAQLASFMRSLGHFTRTHALCTIIFNAAATYQRPTAAESVSIFSLCHSRPSLGQSFAYLVDTHLLLHRLPLSAEDARAVYGTQTGSRKGGLWMASILEVLQDRHSSRVGHWAAFTVDLEGSLKPIS